MPAEVGRRSSPTVNIIGCGRAAGCLARLWLESDAVRIGSLLNRTRASTTAAQRRLGAGAVTDCLDDMTAADFWLIGSVDEAIRPIAERLARSECAVDDAVVFHLAGRFGPEVLKPVLARGALPAALHPARSLTYESLTIEEFRGTACVAEGSEEALRRLEVLVTVIGGLWLPVAGVDRGLYHAALAIVSNITKAVAWKAQTWLSSAGLPQDTADAVAHQLLSTTMEDLFRAGASQSITGPVVRGDTSTVAAHIDALRRTHPNDVEVYRILALTVVELARERGDLDSETLARFEDLLGE